MTSDAGAMAELRAVAAGTPLQTYFRARQQILRFFDGFELLAPGLTDVQRWRQDGASSTRLKIAGGVGRKPSGSSGPELRLGEPVPLPHY